MYGQLYSPCLFQQLPVFHDKNVLDKSPLFQAFGENGCQNNRKVVLTTEKTTKGLLLTFKKQLPSSLYYQAIEEQYYKIRQNLKPTCHVVTDFFGNQYYVANQLNEQDIIDQIDRNAIGRKLAKGMFQDYSLELSHDGAKLTVSSKRDNIDETLRFGSLIADFHVVGCGVVNDDTAVLKIDVIFESKELLEAKYQQEEQEDEKKKLTEIKEAERISRLKQERIRKQNEAKRIVLEKERHRKLVKAMKAKARKELRERLALEMEQKWKQKHEEELKKKQQEEERIKREKTLQEHIEYQKSLVEEEQRRKQEKCQQEALLAEEKEKKVQSNNIVNTNNNFHSDNNIRDYESSLEQSTSSDTEGSESDTSRPLRRYSSPVLEEVEDNEMRRYNESLNKSPHGFSIIEDI